MLEALPILLFIFMPHIVIGLSMIIIPRTLRRSKEKRCDTQVIARCTGYEESSDGYTTPVFRFSYMGAEKELKRAVYSTRRDVEVGQQYQLMVNLKAKNEFIELDKKPIFTKILTIIGSVMVIGPALMLIAGTAIILYIESHTAVISN